MNQIIFDENADSSGHFLDYITPPYPFEESVARLYALAGYEIFDCTDEFKLSFNASGTYKGKPFSIYDWKCDNLLHVGGKDDFDIVSFKKDIVKLMKTVKPKHYEAKYYYNNCYGPTHSYPN